ncbi:MAG: hypothetical protein J0H99_11305, partial [Rhodospirillales bacterium]|nr:hypothetical protein [Rhodospirillales bacterium]
LTLYWMETVIVAVRTILQVAISGDGKPARASSRIGLALFFTFHAGIFIGVHFVFLWLLFSGDWPQRTGGVLEFFRVALVEEGLWVPRRIMALAQAMPLLEAPMRNLLARTYHFLAPRYMPTTEWVSTLRPPKQKAVRGMVW